MSEIPRFKQIGFYGELKCVSDGDLCRWADVERLQKELQEMTARAFAAVWLLVQEGVSLDGDFQTMHDKARSALFGEDKRTIAKLQDEIARLQDAYKQVQRPPQPGVSVVYGRGTKYPDIRHVLMLTRIEHGTNGGLEIEVRLP